METQTKVSLSKGPGVMQEQHSHILNNCGLCLLDHLELVTIPAQDFTSASEKQYSTQVKKKQTSVGASPVVQWLKICLAVQGTQVQSLVWELRAHMLQSN